MEIVATEIQQTVVDSIRRNMSATVILTWRRCQRQRNVTVGGVKYMNGWRMKCIYNGQMAA